MLVKMIEGCTGVIGKDQGYLGLPIKQHVKESIIGGNVSSNVHTDTAWEPTPDELKRLNEGHSLVISLMLFGGPYPPIMVYVDDQEHPAFVDRRQVMLDRITESLEEMILFYRRYFDEQEVARQVGSPQWKPEDHAKAIGEYQALIVTLGMFQGWPK